MTRTTRQTRPKKLDLEPDLVLRAIARLLDGTEWEPETLEQIAEIVRAAGFEIRDPDDETLSHGSGGYRT